MKIKIIKDKAHSGYGSINSLIGNTYTVQESLANGVVVVNVPEWEGVCTVFNGEYEVVED